MAWPGQHKAVVPIARQRPTGAPWWAHALVWAACVAIGFIAARLI